MTRQLDDPLALLRVANRVNVARSLPETLDDRLSDLGEAVSIATSIGDTVASLQVNYHRAIACLQAGQRAEFDAHLDVCTAIAGELEQPFERWQAASLCVVRSMLDGDLATAEEKAEATLVVGADSVPEALTTYGAQLLEIRRLQGRSDEMVDLLAQAAVDNPGIPVLRAVVARIYCDLDRRAEALAVIHDDIADQFARFPRDQTWVPGMAHLTDTCALLADRGGARTLHDRLLPWHAQVSCVGPTCNGPVALYLAMLATVLGAYADAEGHFREALEMGRKLEAPYWTARTQAGVPARMLQQRIGQDDQQRAQTMLATALDTAGKYRLADLEQRAQSLLV